MAKITVYHFEFVDTQSGEVMRSKAPATLRAIDAVGGAILPGTEQLVDIEMLNQDGVVVRWPKDAPVA
jgi:hypothetical protein